MTEIQRILAALAAAPEQPATLATLVQLEGSSYRRPGARLLLRRDGTRVGSISGGCLDRDVIERAERVMETGRPKLAVYDTTEENDELWGVGTGCQGLVRILLEPIPLERPPWIEVLRANQIARRETALEVKFQGAENLGTRLAASASAKHEVFRETIHPSSALLICGAGDDAQPLVRMAKETGWQVTIADTRAAYATTARFPEADRLLVGPAQELVPQLPLDTRTFAVVMTHRFEDDAIFLRALLSRDVRYIGQLRRAQAHRTSLAKLSADGLALEPHRLARLHAPVGLDLGGTTPETVALAILAEMQGRLAGRPAGNLRDRVGPIHG